MESSEKENADATGVSEDGSQFNEISSLCLEDSTVNNVPMSFKNMIRSFSENELHTNDVFAAVLYILAVECGFTWNTTDKPWHERYYFFDIRVVHSIPKECFTLGRIGNGEFRFILYLSAVKNFKCTLSITPCAENFIVNIYSSHPLTCFSQAFFAPEYFVKSEIKFSTFRTLCVNCKNNLFYPMKSSILREANIVNSVIQDMPTEVIMHIVMFISLRDFLNLCSVNHYFYDVYGNCAPIWKYFCKRYNLHSDVAIDGWKSYFRARFKETNKFKSFRCVLKM